MSHNTINEYRQLKAETSELLSSVGNSLIDLCQGPPSEEHAEAYVAIDEQIQKFWNAYYGLKKRHELSQLSVAVLALTKSGKSTLINSFLGNELLPVNNVPETARICRITHAPAAECPEPVLEFKPLARRASSTAGSFPGDVLESAASLTSANSIGSSPSQQDAVVVVRGAEQIREHLHQLNRDVRSREYTNADEQLLEITSPLVVLDGSTSSSSSSSNSTSSDGDYAGIKLCLLDTPGPNEAGEEGLKYQVERLLDGVDAAIYLLDYTKLKTAEEAAVLERLKSINPSLVARLCSRLFFAVNKMDQAGDSCGLDEDETREYVAEMVTRQLNCPSFKLHPDQVLLLSARNALLSRLVLQDRADPDNLKRFSRIAFGAFNSKSSTNKSTEVMRAAASEMLEGSGVPELEQAVLGFLFEAAAGVKLVAVLDDMGRLLTEVSNVAASCRGALAASASRLAASTQALQSELDITLNQFDCVMEGTEDLQVEVVDELRAHLGNLRTRLFQFICTSLDTEALQNAAAANAAAAAAEAGCSSSSRHSRRHRHHCHRSRRHHRYNRYNSANPSTSESEADCSCDFFADPAAAAAGSSPRGWRKLRERFVGLFGSWAGAGCESKDELSSALMDLSEDLMGQVQIEVGEMWCVMETAANARAGRLVDSLNAAMHSLSAKLEGVVEEGLQIRLEPVTLRMAAPDACQFHADLTELIEKGIGAEQARHVRSCERTELVWEARRGVCRLTPYYVQVPRRRRIVETYTSTNYVLKPDAVAAHFMGVVDAAITASERQLAAYVKEYVRRQVDTARNKVKEYGDRYLDSMGAALDAASQGADARAAALAQLEGYCNTLATLRSHLSDIQARAELLVPHNSGTGVGCFEQLDYLSDEDDEQQQQQAEAVGAEGETAAAAAGDLAAAAAASGDLAAVVTGMNEAALESTAEMKEDGIADVANAGGSSSSSGHATGIVRSGSGGSSSSSCPVLLTAEEVSAAAHAEAAAAAAAAGTLLMRSLPMQQQQHHENSTTAAPAAVDAAAGSSDSDSDDNGDSMPGLIDVSDMPTVVADSATEAAGETDWFDGLSYQPLLPAAAAPAADVTIVTNSECDSDMPGLVDVASPLVGSALPAGSASDPAAVAAAAAKEGDAANVCDDDLPNLLSAPTEEDCVEITPPVESPASVDPFGAAAAAAAATEPRAVDLSVAADTEPLVIDLTETLDLADEDLPVPCDLAAAGAVDATAAAAPQVVEVLSVDDILGGLPIAAAADGSSSDANDFMIDISSIAGAQLAVDPAPAAATGSSGSVGADQAAHSGAAAAASPAVSPVSVADTAVSDSFSVMTAGSHSTQFSGMTAGTGFTLGSNNTHESAFSRTQENLADSLLAGTAAAAGSSDLAAAAAGVGSMYDAGASSIYSNTGGFSYHSAMLGPALAASAHSAAAAGSSGSSSLIFAPTQQQPEGAAAAAAVDTPLDTSMYASIVAHSSDDSPTAAAAGSSGTPGSSANYDFQRDFAAALSAAGLDGVAAASPQRSESGSDDWCLVDAEQQQ